MEGRIKRGPKEKDVPKTFQRPRRFGNGDGYFCLRWREIKSRCRTGSPLWSSGPFFRESFACFFGLAGSFSKQLGQKTWDESI